MLSFSDSMVPLVPYVALLLRVWLGANYLLHVSPKLGKGTAPTLQWIKGMGLPVGAAYGAIGLELFGGLFLIVGFLVPLVALLFAVDMVANSIMKRSKMQAVYIGQNKPTYEIDALYLMLSLALLALGAGALSVDGLLGV